MRVLLNILAGLLLLVQSYRAKKEQTDAQQQANQISQDPVDWFNTHFDGGMQQSTEASTSETSDTSGQSK